MGADLIFSILPKCSETPARRAALQEVVDILKPTLDSDKNDSEFSAEELQIAADAYWSDFAKNRSVGVYWNGDFPYQVWVTGGMSWGEYPTEACRMFHALEYFEEIWNRLRQWAIEDKPP